MRIVLLILITLVMGCGLFQSESDKAKPLISSAVYDLNVPEPSGLAFVSPAKLFCVSDPPNNRIYQIDSEGNLLNTLSYRGDDLEGVAFDPIDSTLWVVEEGLSELVHVSATGEELSRWQVAFEVSATNGGFEGVARDPERDEILIVSQTGPPTVLILGADRSISVRQEVDFASNLTGICPGRSAGEFFLISDRDKRLYIWSRDQGLGATFSFDHPQIEGVAYDPDSGTVYLVSDSESRLYTYTLPVE